jgi:hypothetical protein
MAWMSVNAFKRRFKIGKAYEDEKVDYEAFHTLKTGDGELFFEMKKRYVRLFSRPLDSAVPFDMSDAEAMIAALEKKIEKPVPQKGHHGMLKKNEMGLRIYGQFNDAHDIAIVVLEEPGGRAAIRWSAAGLPHLREKEVEDLIRSLSRFVHEKKKAGKPCKECRKL